MQNALRPLHKGIARKKVDLTGHIGKRKNLLAHWRLLTRALWQNSFVLALIAVEYDIRISFNLNWRWLTLTAKLHRLT